MSNRPRSGRRADGGGREKNGFQNPQYGPGTQTVDPDFEKEVRQKLDQFKNSMNPDLRFPPMENFKRKRCHELARQKGLHSMSTGRDPNRWVVVTRRTKAVIVGGSSSETQPVDLTPSQKETITNFLIGFPIPQKDVDDHLDAKIEKKGRNNRRLRENDRPTIMGDPLVPPAPAPTEEMIQFHKRLPVYDKKKYILELIEKNQVTIVTGGTGCGKTTQVPQFLLEQYHTRDRPVRIVCTQPRRLPAIAVAERVSKERGEKLGDTVGYHIRLEQKTSAKTVLTYCTSGVLLRLLSMDELAHGVTHIILDEVHEREQNTDFLLIALREAMKRRTGLKLILMSATMEGNIDVFMRYFNAFRTQHIDVPSRLFEVDRFHLGDVLAITGHCPPVSQFGSLSFNSFSNFSSKDIPSEFPAVEQWNNSLGTQRGNTNVQRNIPESQTEPNLNALQHSNAYGVDLQEPLLRVSQQLANVQVNGCVTSAATQSVQYHPQTSYATNYVQHPQQYAHAQPMEQFPVQYDHAPPPDQHFAHSHHYELQPQTATPAVDMRGPQATASDDVIEMMQLTDEEEREDSVYPCQSMVYPPPRQHQSLQPNTSTSWTHTQSFNGMPATMNANGQPMGWQSQPSVAHSESQAPFYQQEQCAFPTAAPVYNMTTQHQYTRPQFSTGDESGSSQQWDVQQVQRGQFQQTNWTVQQPPPQMPVQPTSSFASMSTFGPNAVRRVESDVDRFKRHLEEEEAESSRMRAHLTNALPGRPIVFQEGLTDLIAHSRLNLDQLVNVYYKCGGMQHKESVDLDLCLAIVKYIMDSSIPGAILVFLPGYDDIVTLKEKILQDPEKTHMEPVIYTLHSQMNTSDQQRVFVPVSNPNRQRKVILSTNIAEASLTIDDVVFVIDSGKSKEKVYDHESRFSALRIQWIAKSNAEQRAGRAGRCQKGYCFRLYSTQDYENMASTQQAEMQRAAIYDVCLHAKIYAPEGTSVQQFLELAPEPPRPDNVVNSLKFLEQLGALYNEGENVDDVQQPVFGGLRFPSLSQRSLSVRSAEPDLTELGRVIVQLPLDPQLARLLLFSVFLKCLSPVLTLVAALSNRDPFILTVGDQKAASLDAKDGFARRDLSDHLMLIRAFNEYNMENQGRRVRWCQNHYIASNAMHMIMGIRKQLFSELKRANVLPRDVNSMDHPDVNVHSDSWPMVQAAIVFGCYPGVGYVKNGNKLRKIRTSFDSTAGLHPSSVVKRQVGRGDKHNAVDTDMEYVVFQEMSKIDEGLTVKTVSVVPPLTTFLCAGSIRLRKSTFSQFSIQEWDEEDESFDVEENSGYPAPLDVVELDNWLSFKGRYQDLRLCVQMRFHLMRLFLLSISNPSFVHNSKGAQYAQLLDSLRCLLEEDHVRIRLNPVNDLSIPQYHYVPKPYQSLQPVQPVMSRRPHYSTPVMDSGTERVMSKLSNVRDDRHRERDQREPSLADDEGEWPDTSYDPELSHRGRDWSGTNHNNAHYSKQYDNESGHRGHSNYYSNEKSNWNNRGRGYGEWNEDTNRGGSRGGGYVRQGQDVRYRNGQNGGGYQGKWRGESEDFTSTSKPYYQGGAKRRGGYNNFQSWNRQTQNSYDKRTDSYGARNEKTCDDQVPDDPPQRNYETDSDHVRGESRGSASTCQTNRQTTNQRAGSTSSRSTEVSARGGREGVKKSSGREMVFTNRSRGRGRGAYNSHGQSSFGVGKGERAGGQERGERARRGGEFGAPKYNNPSYTSEE